MRKIRIENSVILLILLGKYYKISKFPVLFPYFAIILTKLSIVR